MLPDLPPGSATGTDQLALAAGRGDQASFTELVQRLTGPLHRYLVATGTRAHEADDVVQEAFLRAYRALATYDSRYAFTTWLYTIAHRVRLNRQRSQRPHLSLAAITEPSAPESASGHAPGEAGEAGSQRVWELARSLLPPRHLQALWLRYGEDAEIPAIATILQTNALNVRVMLHRARHRLARHLTSAAGAAWQEIPS